MKKTYLDRETLALLIKIAEKAMKTKLMYEETKYGIVFRPIQENINAKLIMSDEIKNRFCSKGYH